MAYLESINATINIHRQSGTRPYWHGFAASPRGAAIAGVTSGMHATEADVYVELEALMRAALGQ